MKWFRNRKIASKLLLSFGLILCLMMVTGVFSIIQMEKVNRDGAEIANKWEPSVRISLTLERVLARVRSTEFQHILGDDETMASLEKSLNDRFAEFTQLRAAYLKLNLTDKERADFAQIGQTLDKYLEEDKKIIALSRDHQKDGAIALTKGTSLKAYRDIDKQFSALRTASIEGKEQATLRAASTFKNSLNLIIGLLVIAVVLGLILAWYVARTVANPLKEALQLAHKVANNDLTGNVDVVSKDETGQLVMALNHMNQSLSNVVGEVRSSIDIINTAASEIASGNADLSARTESQASSLEETASSMEEITSTVRHNADNAHEAYQLISATSDSATQSGKMVDQVVNTMGEIRRSSGKIADIITVIDGIAFQTNILALNAAVEAARAGEQGRGFAVVATEVRSLAQRSAAAAKEIKELIVSSVQQVEVGGDLVDQAGKSMHEIVQSVNRVAALMNDIAVANKEQSTGIDEINRAVAIMDENTQQNAAMVEQSAAAAHAMSSQTGQLTRLISVFKINQMTMLSHDVLPASKPLLLANH